MKRNYSLDDADLSVEELSEIQKMITSYIYVFQIMAERNSLNKRRKILLNHFLHLQKLMKKAYLKRIGDNSSSCNFWFFMENCQKFIEKIGF